MSVQFSNDAYGIVVAPIGVDDTIIEIDPDFWDMFPDLTGEYYCYLSIVPSGEQKTAEIVKATDFTDGVFTVERGVDGTTAKSHKRGCRVGMRLVSAALYALKDDLANQALRSNTRLVDTLNEQLAHYSEILTAELPVRNEEDEINEDTLNKQARFLDQKVAAIASALSVFATQTSARQQ